MPVSRCERMNSEMVQAVLKCPVCGQTLVRVTFRGVDIHLCYSCRGVWLDAGQLERLLQDATQSIALLNSGKPYLHSREKTRLCPRCGDEMKKMTMGIDSPVVIDSCPRGHGEWYDRGELRALLEQGGQDMSNLLVQLLKRILAQKPEE